MQDLTKGPILKGILLFALPLLLGNFFQMAYTTVDAFIVGKNVGALGVGAIGTSSIVAGLIINSGQGITVGMSLLTSRYFGAKDFDAVKRSFSIGFYSTIILSSALTALALLLINQILQVMQVPATLFEMTKTYMSLLFIGMIFFNLYNYFAASMRALGNSRISLYALIVSNIINAALSAFFVMALHLGIFGAGLGMVISQGLSVIFLAIYIKVRMKAFQFRWVSFSWQELKEHLRIGLPMGLQSSIINIGSLVQQIAINHVGALAIVAFSIGQKYDGFAGSITSSLGIAMATFAAQNLGAKTTERLTKGIKQVLLLAVSYSLVFSAFLLIFNRTFTGLFMNMASDPRIYATTFQYYLANGSLYWLLGVLFITRYTLQGMGDVAAPTLAGTMELVFRSIFAILGVFLGNVFIVLASEGVAWIGSTAVLIPATLRLFRRLRQQKNPSIS